MLFWNHAHAQKRTNNTMCTTTTIVLHVFPTQSGEAFVSVTGADVMHLDHIRADMLTHLESSAAITLPVSFFDLRRAQKHGRTPQPVTDRLFLLSLVRQRKSMTHLERIHVWPFPISSAESLGPIALPVTFRTEKNPLRRLCMLVGFGALSPTPLSPPPASGQNWTHAFVVSVPLLLLSSIPMPPHIPVVHVTWTAPPAATTIGSPPTLEPLSLPLASFPLLLRPPMQTEAVAAIKRCFSTPQNTYGEPHSTCVQLPCGAGKTVVGLAIAHWLLYHARVDGVLVLTHTRAISDMWERNLLEILCGGIAPERKRKISSLLPPAIRVMTLQSLTKKDQLDPSLFPLGTRWFALIDEVHHMPAASFRQCILHVLDPVRTPYRLGLTGTMERKDGYGPMVPMLLCSPPQRTPVYYIAPGAMNRRLRRLIVYNIVFPLQSHSIWDELEEEQDETAESTHAVSTSASASANAFSLRNGIHGSHAMRARWLMHACVLRDMLTKYAHAHVLVLTLTIAHVELLLRAFLPHRQRDEGGFRVLVDVAVGSGVKARMESILRELDTAPTSAEPVDEVEEPLPARRITVATVQTIGEGFNDTSIDCIVFADQAFHMIQNASRLRDPACGTIAYVSSVGLLGATGARARDLRILRQELYTGGIDEDAVYCNRIVSLTEDSERT